MSLSVTNLRATNVANAVIEGIVPAEAQTFSDSMTTGGGRCGAFAQNPCDPLERVGFSVDILAGQTVTVTMPPVLRNDVAPGTVVRFVGWFRENNSNPPILATDAVTVEEGM
jgi:hypothetical protein